MKVILGALTALTCGWLRRGERPGISLGQDSKQAFPESRHRCPDCTFAGTGREATGRGVGVLVFH